MNLNITEHLSECGCRIRFLKIQEYCYSSSAVRSQLVLKNNQLRLIIGLIVASTIVVACWIGYRSFFRGNIVNSGDGFVLHELLLEDYDLNDIGVVDINADYFLDIFTLNHSGDQSLLINRRDLHFDPKFHDKLLSQSREYPAVEDSLKDPAFNKSGVYIYRKARWLYIKAYKLPLGVRVTGTLSIPWPIEIDNDQTDANAISKFSTENNKTILKFSLIKNGMMVLNGVEDIVELPHSFIIGGIDLDRIYVGIPGITPPDHSFILRWRDRHGIAWSDVNGDRQIDAFVVRGGVKGQLDNLDYLNINDELFTQDSNGNFRNEISDFGFKKGDCPGRSINWVDINSDLQLDLHIVCSRSPTELTFPDQLWQRQSVTNFSEVAASVGLANPGQSVGIWVDFNNDGLVDYIASQSDGIFYYENKRNSFFKHKLYQGDRQKFEDVAAVDFDSDGDIDLLGVGKNGSLLISNVHGSPEVARTEEFGLPAKSIAVNWVDYDNDGLMDIHFVPQGIFRQQPAGEFVRMNILTIDKSLSLLLSAECSFFDANNDGSVDSLCGFVHKPPLIVRAYKRLTIGDKRSTQWTSSFHANTHFDNHWLQVKLVGPPMNLEAIGAKIFVTTSLLTQMRHVGYAEGARFSQGHYRTYFGMGKSSKAEQVRVVWPDGTEEIHNDVDVNRLLVYEYNNHLSSPIIKRPMLHVK